MANYARYSTRFIAEYTSCHQHLYTQPDIFIYLMDEKNKPICFFRDSLTNYTDETAPTKWVPFVNDLAIGVVKNSHEAGLLCFRLYVHETHKRGRWDPNKV